MLGERSRVLLCFVLFLKKNDLDRPAFPELLVKPRRQALPQTAQSQGRQRLRLKCDGFSKTGVIIHQQARQATLSPTHARLSFLRQIHSWSNHEICIMLFVSIPHPHPHPTPVTRTTYLISQNPCLSRKINLFIFAQELRMSGWPCDLELFFISWKYLPSEKATKTEDNIHKVFQDHKWNKQAARSCSTSRLLVFTFHSTVAVLERSGQQFDEKAICVWKMFTVALVGASPAHQKSPLRFYTTSNAGGKNPQKLGRFFKKLCFPSFDNTLYLSKLSSLGGGVLGVDTEVISGSVGGGYRGPHWGCWGGYRGPHWGCWGGYRGPHWRCWGWVLLGWVLLCHGTLFIETSSSNIHNVDMK